MSALPRPDVPPGPHRDLVERLHELHHRAGWPSLRALARQVGVSHTTISKTFSSVAVPPWGTVELVVEAMNGDIAYFHDLWLAASTPGDRPRPSHGRIAGRRDELAVVRRQLSTGTGLLLIAGEAGMGKTKLVAAAAQSVQGVCVARASCLPMSSTVPLLPFSEVLRSVRDSDHGQWLEKVLSESAPYVGHSLTLLLPELRTAATTTAAAGVDEWARQRLFSAVGSVLGSLSDRQPLVVVLEDLHWADQATLELLEQLCAKDPGVAIVGTWRLNDVGVVEPHASWFDRIRRMPSVTTIELDVLDRAETSDQLEMLTGQRPDDDLLDSIHQRSMGQPLFTEQLLLQSARDLPMPSLLSDLLDARLGILDGVTWTVARTLGVAERPLTAEQLADATLLSPDNLSTALRELGARHLTSSPHQQDVALRHPLLADAIRRRMVVSEVTSTHAAVAQALASSPTTEAAEIARHWHEAGVASQELKWTMKAALDARGRYASAQEAEHWLRVIELWPADASRDQGDLSLTGAHVAAIEALTLAAQTTLARTLGLQSVATLTGVPAMERADLLSVVGALLGSCDPPTALRYLSDATGIYETREPGRCLALCLKDTSDVLRALGRYDDGAQRAARAAAIMSEGNDAVRYRLLLADHAWYQLVLGAPAAGYATLEKARALPAESEGPHRTIRFGCQHTDMLLLSGGPVEDVLAAGGPGMAAISQWEIKTPNAGYLRANLSRALARCGRVPEAYELLTPVTDAPRRTDRWMIFAELAYVSILRGDLAGATELIRWLDDVAKVNFRREAELVENASACELWQGRPEEALVRLTSFIGAVDPRSSLQFAGGTYVMAARAAADIAHVKPGQRHLLHTKVLELRSGAPTDPLGGRLPADQTGWTASWTAELARITQEEKLQQWTHAAEEWDRLMRPHDAAYCRWRGAQIALRDGRGTVAARLLKRAAAGAREHIPLHQAIATTSADGR